MESNKGIVVIHGLPGSGKLDYAIETDWIDRYSSRNLYFTNVTVANIDFPDLDFVQINDRGYDLVVMINNVWIEDKTSLNEILDEAQTLGFSLVEEIYVESNPTFSEINIKNKWANQIAYKNYLLSKVVNLNEEYVKDEKSHIENGAWVAKQKYDELE